MDIYTRYASGEHDLNFFNEGKLNKEFVKLRPLSGLFDITLKPSELKTLEFWNSILPKASYFCGFDPVLFGHVLTIIYQNGSTNKMCAVSVTKFGCNVYENMILNSSSRFWPACENLSVPHRNSNVRKALAIANLKNFNKLWNHKGSMSIEEPWDETNAGSLASRMLSMSNEPEEIGRKLLSLDLLQDLEITSLVIDTIYDSNLGSPQITEENNKIVTLLGNQMEELFDSLLEYSPQAMDYTYIPPSSDIKQPEKQPRVIDNVINELFSVQSNFTMDLGALLQDFIIPLRVWVLADISDTTDGAMKVNTVFPPTIDEVTRINCILNSTLKVAMEYGYHEVFKVLASILPFFYKAFARHQANISNFHKRFAKFLKLNRTYVFDNPSINKANYSPKIVENIVLGSLFELTKLKLIIDRLHNLTQKEKLLMTNFEPSDTAFFDEIDGYYGTIVETIDSLGCEEPPQGKNSLSSRIFTPSGKLLTELATEWPEELQYGWMNRKVLAIYEVQNTTQTLECAGGEEVLIVFSDHLLFLEVSRRKGRNYTLMLPDVLMNALINQKPLPTHDDFPLLKVKYWCDVKDLLAKSFDCEGARGLTLIAYNDNCFKLRKDLQHVHSVSYLVKANTDPNTTCNGIINQICKAQILRKSSPFHLFKFDDADFTRYYCAHDLKNYFDESSKSPIMVLLNFDRLKAHEILQENQLIFIVLMIACINEHTMQIQGFNRENTLEIDEITPMDLVNQCIKEIISRCMDVMLRSSPLTNILIDGNSRKLGHVIESLKSFRDHDRSKTPLEYNRRILNETRKTPLEGTHFKQQQNQNSKLLLNRNEETRDLTLVSRVFKFFKPKKQTPGGHEPARQTQRRNASILNTGIPRGKKPVFKKLYKPDPLLREVSTVASTISQESKHQAVMNSPVEGRLMTGAGEIGQARAASQNTFQSSHYYGSVDATSDFHFPLFNELDKITKDRPENKVFTIDPKPIRRMGSVTYIPRMSSSEIGPAKDCDNRSAPVLQEADTTINFLRECDPNHLEISTDLTQIPARLGSFRESKICLSKLEGLVPMCGSESETSHQTQGGSPQNFQRKENSKCSDFMSGIPKAEPETQLQGSDQHKSSTNNKVTQEKIEMLSEHQHVKLVAKSLTENGTTSSVSPLVYSRYKMYEDLPLAIFNADDEENWSLLARDSLSNLQVEVQTKKDEKNIDTMPAAQEQSCSVMEKNPKQPNLDTPDSTCSSFDFVSHGHDLHKSENQHQIILLTDHHKQNSSRDSLVVEDFEKQLDANFGLIDLEVTDSKTGAHISNKSRASILRSDSVQGILAKNNSDCSNLKVSIKLRDDPLPATSDEEYFPFREFSETVDFWKYAPEHERVASLSSSEETLMNDPDGHREEKESFASKWIDDGRSTDLVDNLGSIAFLSSVLSGEDSI